MTIYPEVEDLIEINKKVLSEIKVRKADRPALVSRGREDLEEILKEMKDNKGDLYDKAVILLKGLIQTHPFESGNRRTALVATAAFLRINDQKIDIVHNVNILQGIRENYYEDSEIKKWLKGEEIREFER